VLHHLAYGISSVFLALYLDAIVRWPLAWVVSPLVLHAACELILLLLALPLAPRPPSALQVACSDGNASITWAHDPGLHCVPVRFIVDLKPDRSDVWLRKHVGRECSYAASNLPPSRTFSFRVRAQDPSGAISTPVLSEPFTILHRMPPRPEPPRALKFIRQIRRNKADSRDVRCVCVVCVCACLRVIVRTCICAYACMLNLLDISVSLLAVVAWLKAEEGASFTLEAATLLSDENAWRVIYTGPLFETRVPNIPPATAFKLRLTVRAAAVPVLAAMPVVLQRLMVYHVTGPHRLWHVPAV